jgi:hypothetical protein
VKSFDEWMVQAWWQAVKKRPSVANTFVSESRLIASYKQYANNTGTSDFAKAMQGAISKPAPAPVAPLPSSTSANGSKFATKTASAVAEGVEAANADAIAAVSRAAAENSAPCSTCVHQRTMLSNSLFQLQTVITIILNVVRCWWQDIGPITFPMELYLE